MKLMQSLWFAAGIVIGMLVMGLVGYPNHAAASSTAAPRIVGGNGFLIGYDVQVGGETVCSDPYVWAATKEIECDE